MSFVRGLLNANAILLNKICLGAKQWPVNQVVVGTIAVVDFKTQKPFSF